MTLDAGPYAPRRPADADQRGVALVFQEITINPSLIVAENIFIGAAPELRRAWLLDGGECEATPRPCWTLRR